MSRRPHGNAGGVTPLELLLLSGIAALLAFAVAPTLMRACDASRVDVAAYSLARCTRLCKDHPDEVAPDGGAPKLEMIRYVSEKHFGRDLVWPACADQATFDPGDGDASISLKLFSGERTVRASDRSDTNIY